MARIVWGEQLYGQVERVRGLFYVATQFFHIQYLPLYPTSSYVVIEGTDEDGGFRGQAIPFSFKSIIAGYARGWLAAVMLFAGFAASMSVSMYYVSGDTAGPIGIIAALITFAGLLWWLVEWDSTWYWPVQTTLLVAMAVTWFHIQATSPNLPAVDQPGKPSRVKSAGETATLAIPIAALALMLYSSTFFLSLVSPERAVELGQTLGLPPELINAHMSGIPADFIPPPRIADSSDAESS